MGEVDDMAAVVDPRSRLWLDEKWATHRRKAYAELWRVGDILDDIDRCWDAGALDAMASCISSRGEQAIRVGGIVAKAEIEIRQARLEAGRAFESAHGKGALLKPDHPRIVLLARLRREAQPDGGGGIQ